MKLKINLEKVIEEGSLKIKDLSINNKKYSLEIVNADEKLFLNFNEDEYTIRINENGIRFSRLLYRPSHDHNDSEDLQVVTDAKKFSLKGFKKGELFWSKCFPYNPEKDGCDIFYIPFGSKEE